MHTPSSKSNLSQSQIKIKIFHPQQLIKDNRNDPYQMTHTEAMIYIQTPYINNSQPRQPVWKKITYIYIIYNQISIKNLIFKQCGVTKYSYQRVYELITGNLSHELVFENHLPLIFENN